MCGLVYMCGSDICVVQYICVVQIYVWFRCVVQIYVWFSIHVWCRYMCGSVYMCGSDICVCVEGLDIVMRSASPHCGPAVPRPYFPFIFYICFIFVLYFHICPPAIFPFFYLQTQFLFSTFTSCLPKYKKHDIFVLQFSN